MRDMVYQVRDEDGQLLAVFALQADAINYAVTHGLFVEVVEIPIEPLVFNIKRG